MDIASIGGAVGGVVGAISNIGAAKRQQKRTKELMDISQKNQKELNQQQYDNSMKFWNETNYDAQVKQMEKAGLNVGMMYGGGGGTGGQTTGMSAGSAASAGGAADIPVNTSQGMDIASTLANIEAMKASADKMRAEAENLRGADRKKTEATTALTNMQTQNQEIVNNINKKTIEEQIFAIKANADKAQSEARKEVVNANISETTQADQEKQIKNMAIASALEAGLKQSQINLTKAQIDNMAEQIAIGKFNANNNAEFQGMDKVAGSQVNKLINKIYEAFGVKQETETQNKIK